MPMTQITRPMSPFEGAWASGYRLISVVGNAQDTETLNPIPVLTEASSPLLVGDGTLTAKIA